MLKFKKLSPNGNLSRGSVGAAGYDLYCAEEWSILPLGHGKVKTGIAVEIPSGYVGIIRDRSSLGSKGIFVSAGVIDSDYRGEILVCFNNFSTQHLKFYVGDRIAQLVVVPCMMEGCEEVSELSPTERDTKGFGSTGA